MADGRAAAMRLDVFEEVLRVADQGAEHVAGTVHEYVPGGVGARVCVQERVVRGHL